MKKIMYSEIVFILFVSCLLMFPQNAYAYLDPGTGSLILQSIIAGLVGATFIIKVYFNKIKTFFANHFSKRPSPGKDNE